MFADNKTKLQKLYKAYAKPDAIMTVGTNEDDKVVFSVQYRLSMNEAQNFVDNVCGCIVNPDNGTFHPEMKDYYIRVETIKSYTNLSTQDECQWWDIVYGTPIFAMITGSDKHPVVFDGREYDDNMVIDTEQYERILDAIDQKIAYYIKRTPGLTE